MRGIWVAALRSLRSLRSLWQFQFVSIRVDSWLPQFLYWHPRRSAYRVRRSFSTH